MPWAQPSDTGPVVQTENSRPPTWEDLIADVRSGLGSAARHDVGHWAIEQVRAALGESWPQRWYARFGSLPAFLRDAASNAFAYAQLIETGLRLNALAGTMRLPRLTKEWSSHLEGIRLLHVGLQLEIAALARSAGALVEFETPIPQVGRPADVVVTAGSEQLVAECFCVYGDQATGEAMGYDRELGFRLVMMAESHDVIVSGHWDVRLPPRETQELLAEAESVIGEVVADGIPRSVTRPDIELRFAPGPHPVDETVMLDGPGTRSAAWRRARGIIRSKAQDWAGTPLPVWLRFDLLDGTWLLSDWAQKDLPEKTEWMAALLADAVGDVGTAGVVVSCGQRVDPGAVNEEHVGAGGITGIRRHLDALRMRETIIVPLSQDGARQAALWRDLYDRETQWLGEALRSASLPDITAIETGWSVPVPEGNTG